MQPDDVTSFCSADISFYSSSAHVSFINYCVRVHWGVPYLPFSFLETSHLCLFRGDHDVKLSVFSFLSPCRWFVELKSPCFSDKFKAEFPKVAGFLRQLETACYQYQKHVMNFNIFQTHRSNCWGLETWWREETSVKLSDGLETNQQISSVI